MARMTLAEATVVNVVISYLAGKDDPMPRQVANALETLASRAHNRLQTGWDEAAVRRQWPDTQESPTAERWRRVKPGPVVASFSDSAGLAWRTR
jgi:hypothetical protein